MDTHYDAIVIGAGVGGLAAAGVLSRAGQRVLVLERHAVVGGCCSTFRRAKFIFDAAVHAIGGWAPGDIIRDWFEELDVEQEMQFATLDPFYSISVEGDTIHVPANLDELAEVMRALSPGDAAAIYTLIEDIKTQGQLALDLALGQGEQAFSLRHTSKKTWAEYLAGRFASRQIEVMLHVLCMYAGLEPEKVSALFMLSLFYSYHRGAYYPMGSTQRFVDTMASAIRRWGGIVRRRANVQHILLTPKGRACGVRLATGEEIYARVVISNADATKTLSEWVGPQHLPPTIQRMLKRCTLSPTALVLYLAVRADGWSVPSHETFYLPAWESITPATLYYQPGQADARTAFSVCVPSMSDPTLAPAGCHVVAITSLAQTSILESARELQGKAVLEQEMLAHTERLVPGMTQGIIYRELATARTIERYTNNNQGAIYGWAKDTSHWMDTMRTQAQEIIPGLYLAGHWTQGSHGVYGSFLSGVAAARAVMKAEKPFQMTLAKQTA